MAKFSCLCFNSVCMDLIHIPWGSSIRVPDNYVGPNKRSGTFKGSLDVVWQRYYFVTEGVPAGIRRCLDISNSYLNVGSSVSKCANSIVGSKEELNLVQGVFASKVDL